jgi:thiol-disulfide isomerase/thioredoxin
LSAELHQDPRETRFAVLWNDFCGVQANKLQMAGFSLFSDFTMLRLLFLKRMILGAALAVPAFLGAQEAGIPVGNVAPNAALETLDGRPAQLSQWVGHTPVVLEFWASWCSNCKALEPEMLKVAKEFGRQVKFVGVAVSANQTPDRVRRYIQAHAMPVEMLYDRHGTAVDAYDVPATSYVVVIDRAGKVVYTGSGGGQDLTAVIRKAL